MYSDRFFAQTDEQLAQHRQMLDHSAEVLKEFRDFLKHSLDVHEKSKWFLEGDAPEDFGEHTRR